MSNQHEKRRIVLGVTGSIAAYKSAELARILITWGYEVRVIMSASAQEFITARTFQAITGNPVTVSFWDDTEVGGIGHIQLADWGNALVIAPATADCIAKLAAGHADTPLLAVVLASKAPLLIAPAMNVNMYEHPQTKENIEKLRSRGVAVVDAEEGALACGWNGSGRLADPEEIFFHIRRLVSGHDLLGKKVVVSAGPTREAIDPVRYLTNRSSGKMGVALAREVFRRGADVTLVHGPVPVRVPRPVRCVPVESGLEMHQALLQECFERERVADMVIMAAAVSDYRHENPAAEKLKKMDGVPVLPLVPNPDILAALSAKRGTSRTPMLVGFAVETGEVEDLVIRAREKLHQKGADLIVANLARDAFDQDTNRVWIIDKSGRQEEVSLAYKSRVATTIIDAVVKL